LDELEALRLADLLGLYHAEAAASMGISSTTFGRLLEGARRKVAEALIQGKRIRFGGGEVVLAADEALACDDCGHPVAGSRRQQRPPACPACRSRKLRPLPPVPSVPGRGRCCRRRSRRSAEQGETR